ncbi:hypothetical protein CVO74_10420 [Xanthomonas prunicola]|uniref:Uncharacterized protein n=1 Tax=Xanthomonas prunicola TaxID=2053930 RepID=A0A2N3RL92_9XANT|nr:hypothetical protein XpruCFBP8353_08370 [Xanthomonas prunicola]PKV17530.1 hypothetical protein XpruCFBP8354_08365 [Xanthomonas prunicola]PKV21426.1 hypothetical protein CVO74_10420 [Xanthomonas prunicola]
MRSRDGTYVLRITARDYSGNMAMTNRDLRVRVNWALRSRQRRSLTASQTWAMPGVGMERSFAAVPARHARPS